MTEEVKAFGQRKAFEAAILAANGLVPGNYNPEYDRYVSERLQGQYEGWKLARAQIHSQGGEAVAWICTASRKDVSGFSGYWKSEDEADEWLAHYVGRGCEVTKTPLYTHPADQVADDLTMVKVSRELLQDLRDLAFDQVEHHRAAMGAYKQTRQSAMESVLAQADALLRT